MAEEKGKAIEKDQETTKPGKGKQDELSGKDLDQVSGGDAATPKLHGLGQ